MVLSLSVQKNSSLTGLLRKLLVLGWTRCLFSVCVCARARACVCACVCTRFSWWLLKMTEEENSVSCLTALLVMSPHPVSLLYWCHNSLSHCFIGEVTTPCLTALLKPPHPVSLLYRWCDHFIMFHQWETEYKHLELHFILDFKRNTMKTYSINKSNNNYHLVYYPLCSSFTINLCYHYGIAFYLLKLLY